MIGHKFLEFLWVYQWTDDPLRTFVDDSIGDPELPDPASWNELESYLKQREPDVSPATISAARRVWDVYVAERKKPEHT